jgi:8-oxo-dGTP diphosphatase
VRSGETPEEAARRELSEEIGLQASRLSAAGSFQGVWEGRRDQVHVFELWLDRPPELDIDNREIVGAKLVPMCEVASVRVTGPVAAYLRQSDADRSDIAEPPA